MRIKGTSAFSTFALAEGDQVPKTFQYLRTGKFNHPQYGAFEITTATLTEMKKNFDARIRGIDIALDYFHLSDQDASGWLKSFELRNANTELWATVDWTPKAEAKLQAREVRYFSPDFHFVWEDPESGEKHKNVIFGGGLTNRPFVKEMEPIVAHENTGDNKMTELEKAQAALKLSETKVVELEKKLSDIPEQTGDAKEVDALKVTIKELQDRLAEVEAASTKVAEEKKALEEASKLAEKEKEFNTLLSEGKACAAQKDAFIKDDMKSFIKLAEKTNVKASGHAADSKKSDDSQDQVLKLAEEKVKAAPGMNFRDAVMLAKKELKV